MAAAAAGLFLCSCATVSPSRYASGHSGPAAEREALKDAAAAISQTSWPKPEKVSLGERLSGFIGSGGDPVGISKDDAVEVYIDSLAGREASFSALTADAERHLAAARSLAIAADAASTSIRPTDSDIAIVETAIGDLRENRDIYIAALKVLAKRGEIIEADADNSLKSSFNDAIKSIGAAADRLAERIDTDRSETFAAATEKSERR